MLVVVATVLLDRALRGGDRVVPVKAPGFGFEVGHD